MYGYERSNNEQTCHCGCVFRVVAPGLKGHEEPEEYYCPECHTEYRTRASNSPEVTMITPRTDGKTKKSVLFQLDQHGINEEEYETYLKVKSIIDSKEIKITC